MSKFDEFYTKVMEDDALKAAVIANKDRRDRKGRWLRLHDRGGEKLP